MLSKEEHMRAPRTGTSATLQDSQQQAGDKEGRKHHRNVFNNGRQRAHAGSGLEKEDHRHLQREGGARKLLALDKISIRS